MFPLLWAARFEFDGFFAAICKLFMMISLKYFELC